jgi:hypothetical protein
MAVSENAKVLLVGVAVSTVMLGAYRIYQTEVAARSQDDRPHNRWEPRSPDGAVTPHLGPPLSTEEPRPAARKDAAPDQQLASRKPVKVGDCSSTAIADIGTRLEGMPESGTTVTMKNGIFGVSYESEPAVLASRPGDQVEVCLVRIPAGCPRGDDRGREYSTTNLRTGQSWILPDASHMCGGA